MDVFSSLDDVVERLNELGADRVFYKLLQENDNSKQQIYICDRPTSLAFLRGPWIPNESEQIPKLDLDLYWLDATGTHQAPNAKLIYYPDYPEVRLSGFLKGCSGAPSRLMQAVPKAERKGSDSRVLVIGSNAADRLYCYVSDDPALKSALGHQAADGVLRPIRTDSSDSPPSFVSEENSNETSPSLSRLHTASTGLPHWAAIAFATECIRLLSASLINDTGEPDSQRAAVRDALEVSRRRAALGGDPEIADVVVAGDAYFDPYDVDALKLALSGYSNATASTYDDLEEDPELGPLAFRNYLILQFSESIVHAAFPSDDDAEFLALDYVSIAESVVASDPELEATVWPDLYHIRHAAVSEHWSNSTPVPPEFFDRPANGIAEAALRFRPRARIIRTIGDRLISGPEAAVIELVKNSYDADAVTVRISFIPKHDSTPSQIIFEDDGHGMSFDDIQHKWMEPATSDKRNRTISPAGRRLLGSKGIGRFASARLGKRLQLSSTKLLASEGPQICETTSIAALDWSVFDETDYLEDVSFSANRGLTKGPPGTTLRIIDLRDEWTEKSLERLYLELRRLLSPLDENRDAFRILLDLSACTIAACGFDGSAILARAVGRSADERTPSDSFEVRPFPILDACDYLVDGVFDEEGTFEGTLSVRREGLEPDPIKLNVPLQDGEQPCGIVLVKLSIFDREATSIRSTAEKAGFGHLGVRDARKLLDGMAGVAIYRDNFRVRPYGDAENDWLTLDAKRVQNPSQKIGRNQVAGILIIEGETSSDLVERSSREGLEENGSYRRLQSLILTLLAEEVEPRRRNFRISAGLERKRQSGFGEAINTASLDWTHKIIDRLPLEERKEAQKLVTSESTKLTDHLKDLAERHAQLESQATLGLIIGEVMHQGNTPLTFIENEVVRLINWWPTLFNETEAAKADREDTPHVLNGMNSSAVALRTLFNALSPLAGSKRGDPAAFDLERNLQGIIFLFRTRSDSLGIQFEVDPMLTGATAFGYPADLATAFTNLFDNSIYWLSHHKVSSGKISVALSITDDEGRLCISVSDNGRGVPPDYFASIFDVGFSTKPNGTGLGLSIAREAMYRTGGDLTVSKTEKGSEFIISVPRPTDLI